MSILMIKELLLLSFPNIKSTVMQRHITYNKINITNSAHRNNEGTNIDLLLRTYSNMTEPEIQFVSC